jgi:hypothetical protein
LPGLPFVADVLARVPGGLELQAVCVRKPVFKPGTCVCRAGRLQHLLRRQRLAVRGRQPAGPPQRTASMSGTPA